jgi:hypothetical protein
MSISFYLWKCTYKLPIIMMFNPDIKKMNSSNFIDFKASEFGLFMVSFICVIIIIISKDFFKWLIEWDIGHKIK